jgi:hypothetical protein
MARLHTQAFALLHAHSNMYLLFKPAYAMQARLPAHHALLDRTPPLPVRTAVLAFRVIL